MDMKSISQKLQDDIRKVLEANLHPKQQKIDVHEPEKDEITAHDFKKLRDMKKDKSKEDMQKDEAVHGMKKKHSMQELAGKAAQQAAVAISLIKAGKKKGTMPKPMKEEDELDEDSVTDYYNKKRSMRDQEHKKQDPKTQASHYAQNMVDTEKAAKKAGERGIKMDARDFDYKVRNSVKRGKLPEETELDEAARSPVHGTRKLASYGDASRKAEVRYNPEYEEYQVHHYKDGKHMGEGPVSYHYGDKEDAHNTAKFHIKKHTDSMAKSSMPKPRNEEIELDETKGAPKGFHFTRDGKLKRGDADQDGDGGAMLRSDPLDKQRSKIPKVSENYDVYDDVDETIIIHTPIEVSIQESYTFGDYLKAAKQIVGDDDAVEYANEAFNVQDINIFIMEEMSRGDIDDKVNTHRRLGRTVSMPKYSTKDGKPHAEYTVTDNDGVVRRFIHHGNVNRVENMGTKG